MNGYSRTEFYSVEGRSLRNVKRNFKEMYLVSSIIEEFLNFEERCCLIDALFLICDIEDQFGITI